MIVLDSKGAKKATPNYLGYLLNQGNLSGLYETPFFSGNVGLSINEFTVYGMAAAVPEPTTTVLFLLGLGLLGLSMNRKAKDLPTFASTNS
jgi:hypothetical protein